MALEGIQSFKREDIRGGQVNVGFTIPDQTSLPKGLKGALDHLKREGCTVEIMDLSVELADHLGFAARINIQGPSGIVNGVLEKIGLTTPEGKNQICHY